MTGSFRSLLADTPIGRIRLRQCIFRATSSQAYDSRTTRAGRFFQRQAAAAHAQPRPPPAAGAGLLGISGPCRIAPLDCASVAEDSGREAPHGIAAIDHD